MTLAGNLATEQRLEWLRQRLDQTGQVLIRDAATALDVSEMTVRRDLSDLEGLGIARRVRGGAVAVGPSTFAERHRRAARAKGIIAAKLMPLLPHSGAIAIDASSTMLRLVNAMVGARDLTVVTNGHQSFLALQGKPGVSPVLTGGTLDPHSDSLVGPVALRSAETFLLSHLFVSAAAVDPALGPSEAAVEDAEVKRALAARAGTVVLAVDQSKLGHRALAVDFDWDAVDLLITDLPPDHPKLVGYRERVEVR